MGFAALNASLYGLTHRSSFPDAQLRIVDAPLGAGPESILPVVVMDSPMRNCASWLAQERAPE